MLTTTTLDDSATDSPTNSAAPNTRPSASAAAPTTIVVRNTCIGAVPKTARRLRISRTGSISMPTSTSNSTTPISRTAGAVSEKVPAITTIRLILSFVYEHHAESKRSRPVHRGGNGDRWAQGPWAHQRRPRRRRLLLSDRDGRRRRPWHQSRAALRHRVCGVLSERDDEHRPAQEHLGG